jgi:UDP-N-acetylglucosamine--N-acetylmuramyl-(pentapeptide) pyrophosphoryl-undecaprenol N-acetylglucosamine transferase|tara:strand:- start:1729 stop:2838 length:1110 start_codon:yes stop_codon:yes gene_type:complete
MSSQSPKVIISGGGTGGHIFPAIAIANAIKAINPNSEILFVGAKGKMEMEKVPEAGYPIKGLWISGLQRSLTLKNLSFPFKVIISLWNARKIIKAFKPDVAVGTGGFASGPVLKMAGASNIPTVIQEQNSCAGITNKLLAKNAAKICVAYPDMESFFPANKIVFTGNPVRQNVIQIKGKREQALKFFGLNSDKPTILVVGGSLGARAVNIAIKDGLKQFIENGIQLVWQTGEFTYEEMNFEAKPFSDKGVKVHQFIKEMDLAYAVADLVISRAGAIAVSELCLTKKPSVLVPFPHAAEDHQTKNARSLVNNEAALMVTDAQANQNLVKESIQLLANKEKLQELSNNIEKLAKENSATIIAKEVLALIKQ